MEKENLQNWGQTTSHAEEKAQEHSDHRMKTEKKRYG